MTHCDRHVMPLSFYCWRRGFWFRIYGYGLCVKLRDGHVPLFSERYGYRKAHYFGPLRIEGLRPDVK
jgi:hypothetical protein